MPVLLRPALLRSDHPTWRRDSFYSQPAARMLETAFGRIAVTDASPDEFLRACGLVAPWLDAEVAARQRVRVLLLFARTHEIDDEYADALRYVERALETGVRSHSYDDVIDLLIYHAKLERALCQYDIATDDLYACLELLHEHAPDNAVSLDPSLELELLAQLADYEFYLGHFQTAEQLAHEALSIAPQAPHRRIDAASAARTQANLDRVRGYSREALPTMRHVAMIYSDVPAPAISRGRLEYLVAEFEMDVAENIPAGPAAAQRTQPLKLARNRLDMADELTITSDDSSGRGLVALGRVRYSRLRGTNSDRVAKIEKVMRLAQRLDDHVLLAQAFTALGDELASQGVQERALSCYRQTLGILDGSQVAALGVLARRRLLVAREMAPDRDYL